MPSEASPRVAALFELNASLLRWRGLQSRSAFARCRLSLQVGGHTSGTTITMLHLASQFEALAGRRRSAVLRRAFLCQFPFTVQGSLFARGTLVRV